ncbi:MAG: hypothetical protein QM677_05060 [Microbacterium sp.]
MVAHVLRLRLDLLIGAWRGDARHVARMIGGLALLAAAIFGVFAGGARLRDVSDDVAVAVTVVAGSALTLGFFVAPLVGGMTDQLDPRRFAVLGFSSGRIAGVTLLASVISVQAVALVAIAVATARLWTSHGASLVITAFALVLAVVTCILLAKIALALALARLVLRERRSRELSGLFLVAVVAVVVPTAVFLVSLDWNGQVPSALREAVDAIAVTPLGAAWAIPGRSLQGAAAGPIAIALATILGLSLVWVWLVRLLLTTTERPGAGRERAALGWFALTPGTPAGGIAARSLVYWLRDPRYLVNLLIVPIAAVVVVLPLLLVGVPVEYIALVPAPLMALFFGWLAHNDLAYDSTALWMHVASGVRGVSDRVGRLVPVASIGGVVLAVAIPLSVSLHGRWAILPAMSGVCASLFLCGLGLSSLSSAYAPYPVSAPGDSPFQQPQRTTGAFAQSVVLLGAIVLSIPALWDGWLALASEQDPGWVGLWTGSAIGLAVLIVGVIAGGAVFDHRGGRLMEFVEST